MATETTAKQTQYETKQARVTTSLNYYADPGDGSPPAPVHVGGSTVTNERAAIPTQVTVTDISGQEGFTLDNCGFQLVHHETHTSCLDDGYHDLQRIQSEYFAECSQLLKRITGAERAFIFDHKVRRGPSNWHKLGPGNSANRGPLHRVHIDQSYRGAEFLLRWFMKDEAEALSQNRWQIINLWRPIRPIYKDPLAVADATTVAEADLVAARVVYPDHERETWTVKPNPAHKWYFKSGQKPDEVMLIKCFDTVESVARRVPHSAFSDPEHEDKESRESIEIRAMLFYK